MSLGASPCSLCQDSCTVHVREQLCPVSRSLRGAGCVRLGRAKSRPFIAVASSQAPSLWAQEGRSAHPAFTCPPRSSSPPSSPRSSPQSSSPRASPRAVETRGAVRDGWRGFTWVPGPPAAERWALCGLSDTHLLLLKMNAGVAATERRHNRLRWH